MEDITIEDLWKAVNAKAERQRQERQKLVFTEEKLKVAEDKLQNIWSLLPDPSDIPTLPQLIKMLAKIRKIREDKK